MYNDLFRHLPRPSLCPAPTPGLAPRLAPGLVLALVLAPLLGSAPLAAQNLTGADLTLSGEITQNGTSSNFFNGAFSSFNGSACLGNACASSGESNGLGNPPLRLKWTEAAIIFEDTSTTSFADRDWRLAASGSPGQEIFMIQDAGVDWTTGTPVTPFVLEGGARENALRIAANGWIGLGTSIPQADLHVVSTADPGMRLDQTSSGGKPAYIWEIRGSELGYSLRDVTAGRIPLFVRPGAPASSLYLDSSGNVGLGTDTPEGKLHTKGDGVQLAYFESATGGPVQMRFRTDSTNRRFLAVNNANQVKSQLIFGDTEIKLTGPTDSGANLWAVVGPGGIQTKGPTCAAPNFCDKVFDPAVYTPPSIQDNAAFMWQHQYLPAVGPTGPDLPFNVTEKTAGILHELEKAHIYIEQLNGRLAAQESALAALQSQIDNLK